MNRLYCLSDFNQLEKGLLKMSYYNIGLNAGRQYSSSVSAGEGFGSSMMTNFLHHMINEALNTYIQRAMMSIITQLLLEILAPVIANNQQNAWGDTTLPDTMTSEAEQ